jgi:hypothetical protein
MPEESRTRRLAILIDADNTSPRIAAGLFEEVAKFGEASVRRIYGDFSGQRLKSWVDILQKYAIDPYQQFAYTTGKNASDIALVIDAMDLLHSGRFDGFCLVSSDSDFTRLASRLREQGADVFGGMLVTPYLISMATPESPRLLVEGATTSWFQVYLREFNYSTRSRQLNFLKPAAERARSSCVIKVSLQKTMLVSLLR